MTNFDPFLIKPEAGVEPKEVLPLGEIPEGAVVALQTDRSLFVFEASKRTPWGTLCGKVTRYSEVPMTSEDGNTYFMDLLVDELDCYVVEMPDDGPFKTGEQMYFHGIKYPGGNYEDDAYDVIHTGPISVIALVATEEGI